MQEKRNDFVKQLTELDSVAEKELGFEENLSFPGVRLMNRDGSVNVQFKGYKKRNKWSVYKYFVTMRSLPFYGSILLAYIVLNVVFASLYFWQSADGLQFSGGQVTWIDCFWFSTQTFTTVGYGHISPSSVFVNLIASLEAFLGLIFFAVATGLVYGRFSNSKADIQFSNNILISDHGDKSILTLRLTNVSSSELSDLQAIVIISYIEVLQNRMVRRYKKLDLELSSITVMSTSWTIEHVISDTSPCVILNKRKLPEGLEFLVFISAFDEVYDQTVKARTSYLGTDVIQSAQFSPMTFYDKDRTIVDVKELSSYIKL